MPQKLFPLDDLEVADVTWVAEPEVAEPSTRQMLAPFEDFESVESLLFQNRQIVPSLQSSSPSFAKCSSVFSSVAKPAAPVRPVNVVAHDVADASKADLTLPLIRSG